MPVGRSYQSNPHSGVAPGGRYRRYRRTACAISTHRPSCRDVSTHPDRCTSPATPATASSSPLAGLGQFPRARLGHAPTPLDAAPNLGAALGIELWVKRDDCTGLALGGNKVRQLEFHFGAAQARGADTVLVTGAVQSNLVRLAAAGARRLGMDIEIQLEERVEDVDELYRASGNVLLDRVLGATLHAFPVGEDEGAADAALERRARALAAEGRRPYVIHSAPGHRPLGGLGYVVAAAEVMAQAAALGLGFDAVVCPSGSALTHSGTLVGLRALGATVPVHGVCVRRDARRQGARVAELAAELAAMIDRPAAFDAGDVGGERRGARAGLRQAQRRGARGDGAGGAARGAAARPGVQRQGDGRPKSCRCVRGASPREAGCSSSTPADCRRSSRTPTNSDPGSPRRRRCRRADGRHRTSSAAPRAAPLASCRIHLRNA